jgi:hypothetical protein
MVSALGEEGNKNTHIRLGMKGFPVPWASMLTTRQDNAGKTTLLYRLKVRIPVKLAVCNDH